MSKIKILALSLVMASAAIVYGEPPQGNQPNMEQMKEREINNLKNADLGLTDLQIDSVVSINQQARHQMMPPPPPPSSDQDDENPPTPPPTDRKDAKAKADAFIQDRYAAVLKDPKLIEKVNAYYQSRQKMRGKGPRGDRSGNNNYQNSGSSTQEDTNN